MGCCSSCKCSATAAGSSTTDRGLSGCFAALFSSSAVEAGGAIELLGSAVFLGYSA